MSGTKGTDDDLAGLKVSELKKLCKMNNLPTTGTKAELMGRILENKAVGSSFSALPPEEEARLLGDDDDDLEDVKAPGDEAPPSSTATCTTTATTNADDFAGFDDLISSGLVQPESNKSLTATGSTTDGDHGEAIDSTKAIESTSSVVGEIQAPPSDKVGKLAADILDDDDDEEEGPTVVKLRAVPSDDESQRLAVRASRFGLSRTAHVMSDALANEKLAARAKRFGLPIADATGTATEGTAATSPSSKLSDAERLKRRAERFGSGANGSPNSSAAAGAGNTQSAEKERKALRLQRFGDKTPTMTTTTAGPEEDEQRKAARATKFGLITPPPTSSSPDTTTSSTSTTTAVAQKLSKRAARFGLVG